MERLKNKLVLITGVGIKPVNHIFTDITTGEPSHTPVFDGKTEYKANIGAACALKCAKTGASVHMVSRTSDKLEIVKQWIEKVVGNTDVSYTALDINNKEEFEEMIKKLPDDKELYWVQSVGLGAGSVKIKDNNPYLLIDEIPEELIEAEVSVLKNTIIPLQLLLPRFRKQKETRICIVSSMSAIRSFASGSIHNAAKGAVSRFTNAATIELDKEKIFITDVRPGGVDTGMYDTQTVQDTVRRISKNFNYEDIHYAPPSAVGEAIVCALSTSAHITSVNLVGRGQWPHEGS